MPWWLQVILMNEPFINRSFLIDAYACHPTTQAGLLYQPVRVCTVDQDISSLASGVRSILACGAYLVIVPWASVT